MKIELTEKQGKQAREWLNHHNCGPVFLKDQPIRYSLSYIITGTEIGDIVEVRCNRCGKVHDITDYDTW